MSVEYILELYDQNATLETVGGKGASLARLLNAGLPVPDGFNVTTAAYVDFVSFNDLQFAITAALDKADLTQPGDLESASAEIRDLFAQAIIPPELATNIVEAYAALPGTNPAVAVRSSATAEDLPDASFAGQQDTYLNVSGASEVLAAVQKCWASLWTARAIGYRARLGISPDQVALAVVVQLLIPAEAAGILFTANPLNGARDQAMISAAWGLGEAIVGGIVTPDTLVVEKSTGHVVDRQTADKQVMTVRVNGGTQEQNVPENLRTIPVISDALAAELAHLGVQIEELYATPMDIEWALADGRISIVQARPITTLPETVAEVDTSWTLPQPKGQYMRGSIIDLMPDPLTPLFATLGIDALNHGINRLIHWIAKKERLIFPGGWFLLINGYLYYSVNFTPKQWWALLVTLVPKIPRILRDGIPYWREEALPAYKNTVAHWRAKSLVEMSPSEILEGVHAVLDVAMDHLGSLMVGTMGASAGSEGLFTRVYDRLIKKEGDPLGTTYLMGYNSIPIQSEKALYDISTWVQKDEDLAQTIIALPGESILASMRAGLVPEVISQEIWLEWCSRFTNYLERFGYSIYDLDFGKPLPMDDPAPMIETIRLYLSGGGSNPYQRQAELEARRVEASESMKRRVKGLRGWAFRKSLGWAQKQAEVREDGIAEIGLGYPLLRNFLSELGRRFVLAGGITEAGDIYWLTGDEVHTAVNSIENGESLESLVGAVEKRKSIWQAQAKLTPPPMLPPKKKYMGFDTELFLGMDVGEQAGDTLKGVAASPGKVTATARVLYGPGDFDQMKPGDILVAPITTPAWTPLFAMAAGIVTDVGGPLSHGSIVAREYGIPAVLGTAVATKRITSGQRITIDGSAGLVTLQTE